MSFFKTCFSLDWDIEKHTDIPFDRVIQYFEDTHFRDRSMFSMFGELTKILVGNKK
jgi:hypothetical protein